MHDHGIENDGNMPPYSSNSTEIVVDATTELRDPNTYPLLVPTHTRSVILFLGGLFFFFFRERDLNKSSQRRAGGQKSEHTHTHTHTHIYLSTALERKKA